VIRSVGLGVVCLVGLGAIAAASKMSVPKPSPHETIRPVVSGNKADRLQLAIRQDRPIEAATVDVAYVQPIEQDHTDSSPRALEKPAEPPPSEIAPRHWHDRLAKTRSVRRRASHMNRAKMPPTQPSPAQVSELKECRSDGFSPLLRKLNLSPPCS